LGTRIFSREAECQKKKMKLNGSKMNRNCSKTQREKKRSTESIELKYGPTVRWTVIIHNAEERVPADRHLNPSDQMLNLPEDSPQLKETGIA
jgi:hypothetical protein